MSKLKKIILLLVTVTITLQPTRVFALKESDWDIFDINGIYYFDKDAANCITSNLSGTLSKLYDGNEIISQSDLAKISANRPFYEKAAAPYGTTTPQMDKEFISSIPTLMVVLIVKPLLTSAKFLMLNFKDKLIFSLKCFTLSTVLALI